METLDHRHRHKEENDFGGNVNGGERIPLCRNRTADPWHRLVPCARDGPARKDRSQSTADRVGGHEDHHPEDESLKGLVGEDTVIQSQNGELSEADAELVGRLGNIVPLVFRVRSHSRASCHRADQPFGLADMPLGFA